MAPVPLGYELDQVGREQLANSLGTSPEAVISMHVLRRGLGRAWVAGGLPHFSGAVIQADDLPGEPVGFGADARVLWSLLQDVAGWFCVNVSSEVAVSLGDILQTETGQLVRYYGDVYHVLCRPAWVFPHVAARLLTSRDVDLLAEAPRELQGAGFGGPRALLIEGVVAGAIVDERIVAIAHTSAITRYYADISVYTAPGWRGRGLSTATAGLVAERVQALGLIPVWSAGEDNWASLRVAQKVGFEKTSRRTYVILAGAFEKAHK